MVDYAWAAGISGGGRPGIIDVWNMTTLAGSPVGTITLPLRGGSPVFAGCLRFNNAQTKVYVTNNAGNLNGANPGLVAVIDVATFSFSTWIDLTAVCTDANAIAIDSSDTYAYVLGYTSGTLTQIDLSTNTIVATLSGFTHPEGVCVSPAGAFVYVTDTALGISRIDTSSMAITNSAVTAGGSIQMNAAGTVIWNGGGGFTSIDPTTLLVTGTIPFFTMGASAPFAGAFKLNHAETYAHVLAYVAGGGTTTGKLYWANLSTLATGSVTISFGVGFVLSELAINPSDAKAAIANQSVTAPASLAYENLPAFTGAGGNTFGNFYYGVDIGPFTPPPTPADELVMLL